MRGRVQIRVFIFTGNGEHTAFIYLRSAMAARPIASQKVLGDDVPIGSTCGYRVAGEMGSGFVDEEFW